MDRLEYSEKMRELNVRFVKLYLPTLSDEDLESIGHHGFQALSNKILELAADNFGAVVEKKP